MVGAQLNGADPRSIDLVAIADQLRSTLALCAVGDDKALVAAADALDWVADVAARTDQLDLVFFHYIKGVGQGFFTIIERMIGSKRHDVKAGSGQRIADAGVRD